MAGGFRLTWTGLVMWCFQHDDSMASRVGHEQLVVCVDVDKRAFVATRLSVCAICGLRCCSRPFTLQRRTDRLYVWVCVSVCLCLCGDGLCGPGGTAEWQSGVQGEDRAGQAALRGGACRGAAVDGQRAGAGGTAAAAGARPAGAAAPRAQALAGGAAELEPCRGVGMPTAMPPPSLRTSLLCFLCFEQCLHAAARVCGTC